MSQAESSQMIDYSLIADDGNSQMLDMLVDDGLESILLDDGHSQMLAKGDKTPRAHDLPPVPLFGSARPMQRFALHCFFNFKAELKGDQGLVPCS